MTTSKTNPQVADGTLPPVVGQFISSECLGNFYVNSPSGDIIAMTPRRKLAQAIADAMNRSKGRTAKLLRCGWTVGRDDMLYPPTSAVKLDRAKEKTMNSEQKPNDEPQAPVVASNALLGGVTLTLQPHSAVGRPAGDVAYMRMPLSLGAMASLEKFISAAYGKDCVCTEDPKGWLKVSTPNTGADTRAAK